MKHFGGEPRAPLSKHCSLSVHYLNSYLFILRKLVIITALYPQSTTAFSYLREISKLVATAVIPSQQDCSFPQKLLLWRQSCLASATDQHRMKLIVTQLKDKSSTCVLVIAYKGSSWDSMNMHLQRGIKNLKGIWHDYLFILSLILTFLLKIFLWKSEMVLLKLSFLYPLRSWSLPMLSSFPPHNISKSCPIILFGDNSRKLHIYTVCWK